ncbi:murein tripeptide amidase MpaA, partial [Escherichia coli]|uniref:murein tripeptide amidase MpaA n=1 Tax=Escherichia coli TaxID=562 RepID=UPI001FCF2190
MTVTRPRAERGAFPPGTEHYGRSLLGAPLIWFPAPAASRESGLILAGTHGDENSSVVTLSCALRTLTPSLRRHHVVLCVNPDGCQLGLRANANGVDPRFYVSTSKSIIKALINMHSFEIQLS